MMIFECGPFRIHLLPHEIDTYEAHSPRRDEDTPKRHEYYLVEGPQEISLVLDYQTTLDEKDPERLVQAIDSEGLRSLEALVQGTMRLMVESMDDVYDRVALRQAYIRPGDRLERPRRHRPTLAELEAGARLDVLDTLRRAGAVKIGTREELRLAVGAGDRTKNLYVAVFPSGDRTVPLVAYTLTRVLPAYYRYCPEDKRPNCRLL